MSGSGKKVLFNRSFKRIANDWRKANTEKGGFKKELEDAKVHLYADEENMKEVKVMIEGPKSVWDPVTKTNRPTPYFGGFYFWTITFPDDYPLSPLKMRFETCSSNWRCHPNYYQNGNVCLSSINTWGEPEWTPERSLSSELIILQERLDNIPLKYEPGQEASTETNCGGDYNNCVEYGNYLYGIIMMLEKTPESFKVFSDKMVQIFMEKFIEIEEKVLIASKKFHGRKIKSPMYGMHFECDYISILANLRKLYCKYKKVDYDKDFWCKYYALNDKPYGEYPKISADKNIKTKSHSDTAEETDDKMDISEAEKEGEGVVIKKKMKRNPPSVSAGNYSVGDELISDKDGRTYFVGLTKANKNWWYLKK